MFPRIKKVMMASQWAKHAKGKQSEYMGSSQETSRFRISMNGLSKSWGPTKWANAKGYRVDFAGVHKRQQSAGVWDANEWAVQTKEPTIAPLVLKDIE